MSLRKGISTSESICQAELETSKKTQRTVQKRMVQGNMARTMIQVGAKTALITSTTLWSGPQTNIYIIIAKLSKGITKLWLFVAHCNMLFVHLWNFSIELKVDEYSSELYGACQVTFTHHHMPHQHLHGVHSCLMLGEYSPTAAVHCHYTEHHPAGLVLYLDQNVRLSTAQLLQGSNLRVIVMPLHGISSV